MAVMSRYWAGLQDGKLQQAVRRRRRRGWWIGLTMLMGWVSERWMPAGMAIVVVAIAVLLAMSTIRSIPATGVSLRAWVVRA